MPRQNGSGTGSDNGFRNGIRLINGGANQSNGVTPAASKGASSTGELVDFETIREAKMEEKRRKTERFFFKNLLGVYCVTAKDAITAVELVDVSEDGIAFQVKFDPRNPWPREIDDIPMRLYFSQDSYLEIGVKIQNSRQTIDGGTRMIRYGCSVDKTWSSYEAYQQFVRFLKLYSEHNHRDAGNTCVFYT
jgi:hypothetical protein